MVRKVYVKVSVDFDENGKMVPTSITWEDGTRYEVDRVLDVAMAASRKAGGFGVRYRVRIEGREKELYHDEYAGMHECGRWYVEAKD